MSRFYTDTITVIRGTRTVSPHGGTALSWASPTRTPVTGVRVQALTGSEREGRSVVTHRLLGPLLLNLRHDDRVEYADPLGRTRIYELTGDPTWHRGLTGRVGHVEAELKAVS